MAEGRGYTCKCGYETPILVTGRGMDPIYRYAELLPYYCPNCKKFISILVYCNMKEFEKRSKETGRWSVLGDLDQKGKEIIKRKVVEQAKEGVKCPECHSVKVKKAKVRDMLICPKCGKNMEGNITAVVHGD